MKNEEWDTDKSGNNSRNPGMAPSGKKPADWSHVVIVPVLIHESVLARQITGKQNPSRFWHVVWVRS